MRANRLTPWRRTVDKAGLCVLLGILAATVVGCDPDARARQADFRVRQIASSPVRWDGRLMPMAGASRIISRRLSGSSRVGEFPGRHWLIRLVLDPFAATNDPVFLVENPGALDAIGFPQTERARYSYAALFPYLASLEAYAGALAQVDRPLDATERSLLQLMNNVRLFEGVASTLDVFRASDEPTEYERFRSGGGIEEAEIARLPGMLPIVPVPRDGQQPAWVSPAEALLLLNNSHDASEQTIQVLDAWAELTELASRNAASGGDPAVAELNGVPTTVGRDLSFNAELLYLTVRPPLLALFVSALALLLALIRPGPGLLVRVAGFLVPAVLLIEQVLRIVITGRPPFVDLPGTFFFVGLVVALWAAFLKTEEDRATPLLYGGVIFLTLAALLLGRGSDPFGVVPAVLDSNAWLAFHVGTIALGYAGILVAGILGELHLVATIMNPNGKLAPWPRRVRVISLAGLFLTTTGTVIGGFWADQAWGRFWGWDPKENGALLIVIWVSLVLHARRTGWIRELGTSAGMVIAGAVVLFSWIGVNVLGVGLHSYGFAQASFVSALVAIVGVAGMALVSLLWAKTRQDRERPTGERSRV